MGAVKERLDTLVVEGGWAATRSRAQALVRAGRVFVDGQRLDKPGMSVRRDATITVSEGPRYVSRGGEKLAPALTALGVDVAGRTCLDVGASTGGFTDALLQAGARHVYAVDVGRGQLAWSLHRDARVTSMERTDIRAVDRLPEAVDCAVVDVSFISLRRVLGPVRKQLPPGGECVILVKPQFEAGREDVGKGGVVRDEEVRRRVLEDMVAWCARHGWLTRAGTPSPLTGARGNQEYFVLLARSGNSGRSPDRAARAAVVAEALGSGSATGEAVQ